jgi:CheY-like chemotaxis protein
VTTRGPLALVAHRDPEARLAVYDVLEAGGYRVATCSRGIDALKYVAACKPDLLATGMGLEDMQGLTLARAVKAASPGTRLLLIDSGEEGLRLREIRDGRVGRPSDAVRPGGREEVA